MTKALLKELGVPDTATICENIAAQAAVDFNEGRIDLVGVRLFLTVDATDEQSQVEHSQLDGPDFPMITDATAHALLELLQG